MEETFNLKILFLVLAGGGPEHIRDEATQRETWASISTIHFNFLWIKAGKELTYDSCTQTLYVPCLEHELLKKSWLAANWCVDNIEFDVAIRTNVSTYFDVEILQKYLKRNNFSQHSFGGHLKFTKFNQISQQKSVFISGTGIFMGGESIRFFASQTIEVLQDIPDDIAISQILHLNPKLHLHSIPMLNLPSHHIFLPRHHYIRCKSSWNSLMATRRMIAIHSFNEARFSLRKFVRFFAIQLIELKSIRIDRGSFIRYFIRIRILLLEARLNSKNRGAGIQLAP
jgi:hypothetical protein